MAKGERTELNKSLPVQTVEEISGGLESIRVTVEDIRKRAKGVIDIGEETIIIGNKRVGKLGNTLVFFEDREPHYTSWETLAIGAIAGIQETRLISDDYVNYPLLELYLNTQQAIRSTGVDVLAIDHGHRIEFENLSDPDKESLKSSITGTWADYVKDPSNDPVVRWLFHKKFYEDKEQRSLQAGLVKITQKTEGAWEVLFDPDKPHRIVPINSPFSCTPVAGTDFALLVEKSKKAKERQGSVLTNEEQKRLTTYQNIASGVRTVLREKIQNNLVGNLLEPRIDPNSLQAVINKSFDSYPNLFRTVEDTHALDGLMDQLHLDLLYSGAWLFFREYLGEPILDSEQMKRLLSQEDPDQAKIIIQRMADLSYYYKNVQLPELDWGEKNNAKVRKDVPITSPDITKAKEKSNVADKLGLSRDVLPSSVLGVASLLDLTESGLVIPYDRKQEIPNTALLNYGTTDFANPAEALMLAQASRRMDGTTNESFYLTDPTAHTIGSYVERILIPSAGTILNATEEERRNAVIEAKKVHDHSDIKVETMISAIHSGFVRQYMDQLLTSLGVPNTNIYFSEVYDLMNKRLCQTLGIRHNTAENFFRDTQLTIRDLVMFAGEVEKTAKTVYESLPNTLREKGLNDDAIKGYLRGVFGDEGSWGVNNRKFVRKSTGSEQGVSITDLNPNTYIADLKDHGLTLGGNAWVLLTQLYGEKQLPDYQDLVITHKNTALGGNYVTPLLLSSKTRAYLSPIVRIIPNGNSTTTGDGLDIGAYFLIPSLLDTVDTMSSNIAHPEIIGGKRKISLELSRIYGWIGGARRMEQVVNSYSEPTIGGNGFGRSLFETKLV